MSPLIVQWTAIPDGFSQNSSGVRRRLPVRVSPPAKNARIAGHPSNRPLATSNNTASGVKNCSGASALPELQAANTFSATAQRAANRSVMAESVSISVLRNGSATLVPVSSTSESANRNDAGESALSDTAADVRAIIDVTIAYTWALDTKDFEALRNVFLPNATADLRGVWCDGADAIISRISGALVRLDASQHLIGNHQVKVNGDRATCRCQLQSQHVRFGTNGGDNFLVGGVYEDRLIRTSKGWRIEHRVMRQVWQDGNLAVVARPAA